MKRMSWAATAAVVVGMCALAAPAFASPVTAKIDTDAGVDPNSAGVTLPNNSTNNTTNGGAFAWTVSSPVGTYNPDGLQFRTATGGVSTSSFVSFCIELTQNVTNNTTYSMYTIALADAPMPGSLLTDYAADVMKVMWYQQITANPTLGTNPLKDSNAMAAFQMAIWELVYDPDTQVNSVNSPFRASSFNSVIAKQAQGYLDAAVAAAVNPSSARANLVALTRGDTANFQDQVIEIVPEPSSILAWTLIGGTVMIGRRMRRGAMIAS